MVMAGKPQKLHGTLNIGSPVLSNPLGAGPFVAGIKMPSKGCKRVAISCVN